MKKWKQHITWAVTDDICQDNVMEISNEGTGQDILNKLNVNRDEGNGYTYTIPYSCPSSYTHRDISTSSILHNSCGGCPPFSPTAPPRWKDAHSQRPWEGPSTHPTPHRQTRLDSPPPPHPHTFIYWKEIKISSKTNNKSDWAQKLEDRLHISSVLWLIPYFEFFNGVDIME